MWQLVEDLISSFLTKDVKKTHDTHEPFKQQGKKAYTGFEPMTSETVCTVMYLLRLPAKWELVIL